MLLRMMDGRSHTARDLAEAAGVSAPTATGHLRQLIDAGLVTAVRVDRRRLHALASDEVAAAIESLAAISPLLPVESIKQAKAGSALQTARACYSHLGGGLAVAMTQHLISSGVIEPLTPRRPATVKRLDTPLLVSLRIVDLGDGSGPAVRGCLDWTERTAHLAGRLGSALMSALLEREWLTRGADRALDITDLGARELERHRIWPVQTPVAAGRSSAA